MTGFAKEILETVDDGRETHAAYPSAGRTLCGVLLERARQVASALPDCDECVTAAYNFRRIDRSAPADWFVVAESRRSSQVAHRNRAAFRDDRHRAQVQQSRSASDVVRLRAREQKRRARLEQHRRAA